MGFRPATTSGKAQRFQSRPSITAKNPASNRQTQPLLKMADAAPALMHATVRDSSHRQRLIPTVSAFL